MAWTVASFKVAYPEFEPTPDAIVQEKLNAAARRTSKGFGDRYDDALGLRAAHLLSTAPFGQQSRSESEGEKTSTYMTELKKMQREVFGGPWTSGQGNGGMLG